MSSASSAYIARLLSNPNLPTRMIAAAARPTKKGPNPLRTRARWLSATTVTTRNAAVSGNIHRTSSRNPSPSDVSTPDVCRPTRGACDLRQNREPDPGLRRQARPPADAVGRKLSRVLGRHQGGRYLIRAGCVSPPRPPRIDSATDLDGRRPSSHVLVIDENGRRPVAARVRGAVGSPTSCSDHLGCKPTRANANSRFVRASETFGQSDA